MDIRRLIRIGRAWLPLMVVATIASGGIAFVVSRAEPKVYEARVALSVGQALSASNPDLTQMLVAQNLTSTYATVAKTRQNLQAVIAQLGLDDTPEELSDRVQVDTPSASTLLSITAQDGSPEQAAAIANAMADRLIAVSPAIQGREAQFQDSIDKDLQATQDQIGSTQDRVDELDGLQTRTPSQEAELSTLEGRLATLRSTYVTLLSYSSANATNLVTVIDPAVPPTSPVLPRVALNTILAALFGLLAVIAIAVIAEQLDDSIKDPDEISRLTSLNTLGAIPQMKTSRGRSEIYQLASVLYPSSSASEAYRKLRANLEFASVDEPIRSLLVTSAVPGEGKTVTAANLAVVFAQTGRSVVLIDADLRKPGVHRLFALPNEQGLTSLLRDDSIHWDDVAQHDRGPDPPRRDGRPAPAKSGRDDGFPPDAHRARSDQKGMRPDRAGQCATHGGDRLSGAQQLHRRHRACRGCRPEPARPRKAGSRQPCSCGGQCSRRGPQPGSNGLGPGLWDLLWLAPPPPPRRTTCRSPWPFRTCVRTRRRRGRQCRRGHRSGPARRRGSATSSVGPVPAQHQRCSLAVTATASAEAPAWP